MIKICPVCESRWLDGQLYWATGKEGCPHDLAGLLCNDINSERCINPCLGSTSGVTWAQRRQFLDSLNEKD
tara:strand:- start:157 stop:369 length:213 start_codon:yes stop_codon:yes gene_type:complete